MQLAIDKNESLEYLTQNDELFDPAFSEDSNPSDVAEKGRFTQLINEMKRKQLSKQKVLH